MTLEEKITKSLKEAMKAKDQAALRALRAIKAEILLFNTSGTGATLDDNAEIKILQKMVKQRRESISQYESAERHDLADKEKYEIDIIQTYLPQALSDDEIENIINDAISQTGAATIREMGKVMGVVKPKIVGRADMGEVSGKIKALLNAG